MTASRHPQDFEALSRDILMSTPCLVEMPAGTGKTQLLATMASILSAAGCRTLILTHTNAGVAAIESRLRRLGLPLHETTIATVASWAERVTTAYPDSSGIDRSIVRGDENYFDGRVQGACQLASTDWFAEMIATSHQAVLVDEYQDCNLYQHELVVALSKAIARTVVLGDPLQRIFDFKGEPFPDWSAVEQEFPVYSDIVPYPHRWSGHNMALGEWLLDELRPALLSDDDIMIPAFSVEVARYLGKTSDASVLSRSAYSLAGLPGSSLIICPNLPLPAAEQMARRFSGRYSYIETVEGNFMRSQLSGYLAARDKGETFIWAAEFAKACAAKIVDGLDATVVSAIASGKDLSRYLSAKKRKPYAEVLRSLEALARTPNVMTLEGYRRAVEQSQANLFRREAWEDTFAAIAESERSGADPIAALEARRNVSKHIAGRTDGNIVSRTLLVKGLEFSNVLVTNVAGEGCYSPQNLYVALTRATDRLQLLG